MTVQSIVSTSGENFTVENISKDSAFSFTILVSNTIGVVLTERRVFCEYIFFILQLSSVKIVLLIVNIIYWGNK